MYVNTVILKSDFVTNTTGRVSFQIQGLNSRDGLGPTRTGSNPTRHSEAPDTSGNAGMHHTVGEYLSYGLQMS